ncbi:hypothetical protein [uncultured Streptomyces sp.]|uniref:hypothetical protein n=1 Tax=uncultured Streptomyces sp. TaxID=174707 RepID=UPI002602F195|nr:hypothetical protein [uncultured Streptomyces sp.]
MTVGTLLILGMVVAIVAALVLAPSLPKTGPAGRTPQGGTGRGAGAHRATGGRGAVRRLSTVPAPRRAPHRHTRG